MREVTRSGLGLTGTITDTNIVALPVGQPTPERGGQELDKRARADEHSALAGVHAHLLEVDAHEREQRAERGVEEKVERLDGEQLLVDRAEYQLDDVRLAADPIGRVFGLRIVLGVHFAQRLGVDTGPDAGRSQSGPSGLAGHLVRRRHARKRMTRRRDKITSTLWRNDRSNDAAATTLHPTPKTAHTRHTS